MTAATLDRISIAATNTAPDACIHRTRQREVAGIGLLVGALVVVVSLRAGSLHAQHLTLLDPVWLRSVCLALAVGFAAYALDQEHQLGVGRVAPAAPGDASARPDGALHVLHQSLLVGDTIDALLDAASATARADGVALELVGVDGTERVAGRRGLPAIDGDGPAHRVVLEHDGCHLGHLVAWGRLSRGEQRAFALLARYGAAALVNARRYEHALLLAECVADAPVLASTR